MSERDSRAWRTARTYILNAIIVRWRVDRFVSLRNFRKMIIWEILSTFTDSTGFAALGVKHFNLMTAFASSYAALVLSGLRDEVRSVVPWK